MSNSLATLVFRSTPSVKVEYMAKGVQKAKLFNDAWAARQFYTAKLRSGANPKVLKA